MKPEARAKRLAERLMEEYGMNRRDALREAGRQVAGHQATRPARPAEILYHAGRR